MCWNRKSFARFALRVVEPATGEAKIYRLCFALQNTMNACVLELHESEEADVAIGEVGYQAAMALTYDHIFRYVRCNFHYSDDGLWSAAAKLTVLPNLRFHSKNVMVADGEWRDWEEVATWFPPIPKNDGGRKSAEEDGPGKFEEDVWTRNPWMANWLKFGDQTGIEAESKRRKGASDWKAKHPYAHILEAEDVCAVLDDKRHELELALVALGTPDYQCVLRGGDDLLARTGRPYDTVRMEAKSKDAEDFARSHSLKLSFNMGVDLYDMADCKLVSSQWASRCQHFLDQYRENGNEWDEGFLTGWAEHPGLAAAYARGNADLRARITQVRGLKPKRPAVE